MDENKNKDWKKNFLESYVLGHSTNKNDANAVQKKCVELAYKDMMTVGRYYSNSFLHTKDEICDKTYKAIQKHKYTVSKKLICEISSYLFDDIIGVGNKYVTNVGLGQKLVNMTFKYLYVFSVLIFKNPPDFSLCHCPLDSIILEKAGIDKMVWSKLTIGQYQECQEKIKKLLELKSLDNKLSKLGNLAFDFLNW